LNYTYIFDGGELECELEYNEAERGSCERGTGLQLEPDHPEFCTLETAKLNGVDIAEMLSTEVVDFIEMMALEQTEDYDE